MQPIEQKPPLGNLFDSRQEVLKRLAGMGITITPDTITEVRGGRQSGERLFGWVKAAEFLQGSTSAHKNSTYYQISTMAVLSRRIVRRDSQCYFGSEGFTEELAENFGLAPNDLRRVLRAMRADLVYYTQYLQNHSLTKQLSEHFTETAKSFLADFADYAKKTDVKWISAIDEHWKKGDIRNFYSIQSRFRSQKGISVFPPYEMRTMRTFYLSLMEEGDRITPFDELVIRGYLEREQLDQLAKELSGVCGVNMDRFVLHTHRKVLFGQLPLTHINTSD